MASPDPVLDTKATRFHCLFVSVLPLPALSGTALPHLLQSVSAAAHCQLRLAAVPTLSTAVRGGEPVCPLFCRASAGWVLVLIAGGAEGVVNVGTVVPTERT